MSTHTLAHHRNQVWQFTDEADTVVLAMDAIQTGAVSTRLIRQGLRDIRRLKNRLAAIEQELLLLAREPVDGRPTMSWQEVGEAIGLHHTAAKELHDRVAAGEYHPFRNWLVENTPRADRYPTPERNWHP